MIGLEFILIHENITYKQIAEQLGITSATVGDWISTRRNIPKQRLKQLSEIFGLDESIFQATISAADKLRIQISLIEKESESINIPKIGFHKPNKAILDRLELELKIEEKKENLLIRYTKLINDFSEKKFNEESFEVKKETVFVLRAFENSIDNLLIIFENYYQNKGTQAGVGLQKVKMTREVLYFIHKYFGVDEQKWEDIDPFLDESTLRIKYEQLEQLQSKYYSIDQL